MTSHKEFTPTSNVYLIGSMGAGKSSVGRRVAELAKRRFYDSDHEIEAHSGVSISWIFEKEQESGFRSREALIIQELAQQSGIVLSTGGGAILNEATQRILKETGLIIYLSVNSLEQLKRVDLRKSHRPLLQADPVAQLHKLNQERTALYESLADFNYSTDDTKPTVIANSIWKILNSLSRT